MNEPGDIPLTHSSTPDNRPPCSIISIIPNIGMSSCRGRAEAFARSLSTKLRTLGSQVSREYLMQIWPSYRICDIYLTFFKYQFLLILEFVAAYINYIWLQIQKKVLSGYGLLLIQASAWDFFSQFDISVLFIQLPVVLRICQAIHIFISKIRARFDLYPKICNYLTCLDKCNC